MKALLIASLVSTPFIIWGGYGTQEEEIINCTVQASYYITAEYSESYPSVGFDANGNMATTIETDYWSEIASDVNSVITINGEIIEVRGKSAGYTKERWGVPVMGSPNQQMKNGDFDRFKNHYDVKLTIETWNDEDQERTNFTEPTAKNVACIENVDSIIDVKTWYGISYGSDFL